ncbi:MAG: 5'/3'-nucleotidase SurE [Candidatus Omnitrophica bacterium]|nr:5'/3'-nucleotidase SurE [Candidatus Omnitrophota bacterium]
MKRLALVSNDDGIFADGLNILCEKLAGEFDVAIVAPDSERSNVGHAITLSMPLKIEKVKTPCGITGYSVSGMPADCIKIAVSSLLGRKPDIVVSGINLGSNLGIDVLYSGTVSAATEAVIMGIPAFAISLDTLENPDFFCAANFAKELAIAMLKNRIPENIVLNVNVPFGEPRGVKIVPLSKARYRERYEKRINPRKKEYWWLTGEFMEETDIGDSDIRWVKDGFVTITPLNIDLTDYEYLNLISEWKFENI